MKRLANNPSMLQQHLMALDYNLTKSSPEIIRDTAAQQLAAFDNFLMGRPYKLSDGESSVFYDALNGRVGLSDSSSDNAHRTWDRSKPAADRVAEEVQNQLATSASMLTSASLKIRQDLKARIAFAKRCSFKTLAMADRGWIDPDGKVIGIGQTLHYDWAAVNVLGMKSPKEIDTAEAVYQEMFNLGYARFGNYGQEVEVGQQVSDIALEVAFGMTRANVKGGQNSIFEIFEGTDYWQISTMMEYGQLRREATEALGIAVMANNLQPKTSGLNEWFGDSKVVNDQGQPLRVYHGTPDSTFTEFEAYHNAVEAWFAEDPTLAAEYAEGRTFIDGEGEELQHANIIPAYISIQNPLDFTGFAEAEDAITGEQLNEFLDFEYVLPAKAKSTFSVYQLFGDAAFINELDDSGYDGIKVLEKGQVTWGIFSSSQAKSIHAEKYDPEDSMILATAAAEISTMFRYRDIPKFLAKSDEVEAHNAQSMNDSTYDKELYPKMADYKLPNLLKNVPMGPIQNFVDEAISKHTFPRDKDFWNRIAISDVTGNTVTYYLVNEDGLFTDKSPQTLELSSGTKASIEKQADSKYWSGPRGQILDVPVSTHHDQVALKYYADTNFLDEINVPEEEQDDVFDSEDADIYAENALSSLINTGWFRINDLTQEYDIELADGEVLPEDIDRAVPLMQKALDAGKHVYLDALGKSWTITDEKELKKAVSQLNHLAAGFTLGTKKTAGKYWLDPQGKEVVVPYDHAKTALDYLLAEDRLNELGLDAEEKENISELSYLHDLEVGAFEILFEEGWVRVINLADDYNVSLAHNTPDTVLDLVRTQALQALDSKKNVYIDMDSEGKTWTVTNEKELKTAMSQFNHLAAGFTLANKKEPAMDTESSIDNGTVFDELATPSTNSFANKYSNFSVANTTDFSKDDEVNYIRGEGVTAGKIPATIICKVAGTRDRYRIKLSGWTSQAVVEAEYNELRRR